jgi:hypothetical protein
LGEKAASHHPDRILEAHFLHGRTLYCPLRFALQGAFFTLWFAHRFGFQLGGSAVLPIFAAGFVPPDFFLKEKKIIKNHPYGSDNLLI